MYRLKGYTFGISVTDSVVILVLPHCIKSSIVVNEGILVDSDICLLFQLISLLDAEQSKFQMSTLLPGETKSSFVDVSNI